MSRDDLITEAWLTWCERWRVRIPAELSPMERMRRAHDPRCPCLECEGAIRPPREVTRG